MEGCYQPSICKQTNKQQQQQQKTASLQCNTGRYKKMMYVCISLVLRGMMLNKSFNTQFHRRVK